MTYPNRVYTIVSQGDIPKTVLSNIVLQCGILNPLRVLSIISQGEQLKLVLLNKGDCWENINLNDVNSFMQFP